MKKKDTTDYDAISQKKLMKLLRKGDVEALDQIRTEYFFLIEHILKLFTDTHESVKTISGLTYQKLLGRKREIKDRQSLITIIFEELIKACADHCETNILEYLTKDMNALQEIFLQIEKIHPSYRPVIRMIFRREKTFLIKTQLKITTEQVEIYRELGSDMLLKGLERENKEYAATRYFELYNLLFFY